MKLSPPPATGIGLLDRWLGLLWRKLTGDAQIEWAQIDTTGTADIDGNLTVAGTSTLTGNVTASGSLSVSTTSTLTGNVSMGGTLSVTGTSTLTGNVTASGNMTVNGNTTLGNATTDTITLTGTVQPGVVIEGSSSGAAFRVTQTGSGNAIVVEDSSTPDSTPFVVDATGSIGSGSTSLSGYKIRLGGTLSATAANVSFGIGNLVTFDPSVTTTGGYVFYSNPTVSSGTLTTLVHFHAEQGTFNGSVTSQYGFTSSVLTGATNNFSFHSGNAASIGPGKTNYAFGANNNIATGGGTTWNFYAAGTAPNYFAGDIQLNKTITAAGTTGAQTINKNAGSVNFAAAAASLVVTDSLVTANSVIVATVATNDATMKSAAAVPAAGSFTLYPNAAPTAETRVNFLVIN